MTEEQLLNVPELQAVAVETQVADLLDVAETCVSAGMHIHLDKPAGTSLPQFKRILDTAASKHLLVQMGYMYRYNPAILMLRDFIAQGWLGELFELHTVMSKVVNPGSRNKLKQFSGGIMFELGCHIIDLTVALLGRPDEVHSYIQHVAAVDDGLNDNMLAVFTYPRSLASVKSSAVEVEGFERRHLVVCGHGGTFHVQPLDAPSVRFALSEPRGSYGKDYQDVVFGDYARYVGDAIDMAAIIRGDKDSDYSYEHDYHVQETVLRAAGMPLDA